MKVYINFTKNLKFTIIRYIKSNKGVVNEQTY